MPAGLSVKEEEHRPSADGNGIRRKEKVDSHFELSVRSFKEQIVTEEQFFDAALTRIAEAFQVDGVFEQETIKIERQDEFWFLLGFFAARCADRIDICAQLERLGEQCFDSGHGHDSHVVI